MKWTAGQFLTAERTLPRDRETLPELRRQHVLQTASESSKASRDDYDVESVKLVIQYDGAFGVTWRSVTVAD